MSESCVVEVYEYQTYSSSGWKPYRELPWALKANNQLCKPPDEIKPPSSEWVWTTNWRIDKLTGKTDRDGWEYATRIYRLKSTSETNRKSKAEQSFFDTARRRVWARILRRETVMKSMEIDKALPKIQMGLTSINTARKKIESIMKQSADAIDNEHFQSLIKSVRKNIVDIKSAIQQLENNEKNSSTNNPNAHAIFKKLKNDLTKEEVGLLSNCY